MLNNHQECLALLEQLCWQGKPTCPYCASTNAAALKKEQRYHCNSCFTSYSVTVGTLFHKTRVDLYKWFRAIELVLNDSEKISIFRLAREVGVSKNTAAYMIARIRKAKSKENELLTQIARHIRQSTR
jgi:transposase-like protein